MFFVSFNISDGNIDFVSYFYLHLWSDISKEPLTDMKRILLKMWPSDCKATQNHSKCRIILSEVGDRAL